MLNPAALLHLSPLQVPHRHRRVDMAACSLVTSRCIAAERMGGACRARLSCSCPAHPLRPPPAAACVGRISFLQLAALGPNTALFNFSFQAGAMGRGCHAMLFACCAKPCHVVGSKLRACHERGMGMHAMLFWIACSQCLSWHAMP